MTETAAAQEHNFSIQRIYIKDISFETPNSPLIFTQQWEPKINVEIGTEARKLNENNYEIILKVTVTATNGESTGFLAEVQQAGIFLIEGFSEQEMGHVLHSYCPNILFPYVREAVGDLVNRGSFPQLLLAPVNFDAIYAQHLQRQQQENAEQGSVSVE